MSVLAFWEGVLARLRFGGGVGVVEGGCARIRFDWFQCNASAEKMGFYAFVIMKILIIQSIVKSGSERVKNNANKGIYIFLCACCGWSFAFGCKATTEEPFCFFLPVQSAGIRTGSGSG